MGKKVIYCGAAGQGSMMKMCINLLLGVMMEGFAEVLNFGRLGGLDLETMLETALLRGPELPHVPGEGAADQGITTTPGLSLEAPGQGRQIRRGHGL